MPSVTTKHLHRNTTMKQRFSIVLTALMLLVSSCKPGSDKEVEARLEGTWKGVFTESLNKYTTVRVTEIVNYGLDHRMSRSVTMEEIYDTPSMTRTSITEIEYRGTWCADHKTLTEIISRNSIIFPGIDSHDNSAQEAIRDETCGKHTFKILFLDGSHLKISDDGIELDYFRYIGDEDNASLDSNDWHNDIPSPRLLYSVFLDSNNSSDTDSFKSQLRARGYDISNFPSFEKPGRCTISYGAGTAQRLLSINIADEESRRWFEKEARNFCTSDDHLYLEVYHGDFEFSRMY